MGVIKLIIISLLIWLGFILFKYFRGAKEDKPLNSRVNKMLICSKCNIHIPENEAIKKDGKIYCSKECL